MSENTVGRDSDKFMLRLPDGMRGKLKDAAGEAGRSLNAEIVQRLEASFQSRLTILKRPLPDQRDESAYNEIFRIIAPDRKPTREELIQLAADEMRAVATELDFLLSKIDEGDTPDPSG